MEQCYFSLVESFSVLYKLMTEVNNRDLLEPLLTSMGIHVNAITGHKHSSKRKRLEYPTDSFLGWKFDTASETIYSILDLQVYVSNALLEHLLQRFWRQ